MRFICLIILLLYVTQVDSKTLDLVNVDFEVKDDSAIPLENALIIIQGVTDQSFNKQILTNSDGKSSVQLNKNQIFIYMIYKLSFETVTNNIFTSSNKNLKINLNKIPNNKWYFYYINNGEIELSFKSLDSDIDYKPEEYVNEVLEVKNVAKKNIDLIKEKTSLKIVDANTSKRLRWWGTLKPEEVLVDLTLKENGWLRTTIKDDILEVCAGNAIGNYKGQPFDVSGDEFICKNDIAGNKIPEWILKNNYKFDLKFVYKLDGNEREFNFVTQDFFIDNIDWKPEISSIPNTKLKVNEDWSYNLTPKYPVNFVYYRLEKAPNGMNIDILNGLLNWKPNKIGYFDVVVRAYYPYFDNDARVAYADQKFTLEIMGKGNLYSNNLYIFNKNVKVNENIKISFKVYNDNYKDSSIAYRIYTDDSNFISYKINNLKPYEKRTIYTQVKYNRAGTFTPKLVIDSNNEVDELDETDNIKFFDSVTVNPSINGRKSFRKII